MHFTRLRRAFWQAFQHGQFSIAKGAAYSSILTLFPAFLIITSALEASHNTEGFLEQIADAVGWVLPPGSRSVALAFFQSKQHHATRIIYSASIVTLLAATGVMISWMDGFRKAYGMANTWGFWRERAIALYLVLLALVPLGFATILVAFGTEVENWIQSGTMHLFKPLILLVWDGVRWGIALLTAIALTALMYHHGLPKTQSWRRVLPGAVMAAVLWFPATSAVWLVCEGLCHIHGGLRLAQRGHCPVSLVVYRFCNRVAGSGNERASLSQDGGKRRHGKEGMNR